jgi:hypothetical protein
MLVPILIGCSVGYPPSRQVRARIPIAEYLFDSYRSPRHRDDAVVKAYTSVVEPLDGGRTVSDGGFAPTGTAINSCAAVPTVVAAAGGILDAATIRPS